MNLPFSFRKIRTHSKSSWDPPFALRRSGFAISRILQSSVLSLRPPNSKTLKLWLVDYHEFASCDNIKHFPRTPKSRYSILRNPEMSESDTLPGAGPQLGFSPFWDFNSIDFYIDRMPPAHLVDSCGPTQSYWSFMGLHFASSRALMPRLRPFNSRNPERRFHEWSTVP